MNITFIDKDGNKQEQQIQTRQGETFFSIQLECGDCCKKVIVTNSTSVLVSLEEVVITADSFLILTFSGGKVINRQTSVGQLIIRSLQRVCLLEFDSEQLPLNTPLDFVSPFAIELDCGGCCKKVLNIGTVGVINTFGLRLLTPPESEQLFILTFNNGNLVDLQSAGSIFALDARICTIEEFATEVPTPPPPTIAPQTVNCVPVVRNYIDMSKKC